MAQFGVPNSESLLVGKAILFGAADQGRQGIASPRHHYFLEKKLPNLAPFCIHSLHAVDRYCRYVLILGPFSATCRQQQNPRTRAPCMKPKETAAGSECIHRAFQWYFVTVTQSRCQGVRSCQRKCVTMKIGDCLRRRPSRLRRAIVIGSMPEHRDQSGAVPSSWIFKLHPTCNPKPCKNTTLERQLQMQ